MPKIGQIGKEVGVEWLTNQIISISRNIMLQKTYFIELEVILIKCQYFQDLQRIKKNDFEGQTY